MKKDAKWIILIFLITFLLLFKLFNNPRFYGHDTIFHTGSIIYLSKTISLSNIFGSNIIKLNTNIYGYGTWLFYPKLPHLLGAYLYLIFKNVYISMNIVYFITTFLSGVSIYYLSKKIFNNKKVAFLSGIIYLTYSYHLCEIYIRDAYAENFMFMVIPLIFLGLFELKDNNIKKFYLYFITGYTIGMYSHLISMVFITIFVALFILFYRKIFFKKNILKSLLISTIIVTSLTLPFLTTIIEHKILGNYIVFSEFFSSKTSTSEQALSMLSYIIHSDKLIINKIIVYINYTVLVLILLTTIIFLFKKNINKYKEERKLLFFGSLICIALINSNWLWEHIPKIFSTIQFPWRITTLLCLIISLYAPLFFLNKYKYIEKKLVFTIVICINILEAFFSTSYYGYMEYSNKEILNNLGVMGWQLEYLPNTMIKNNISELFTNIELINSSNTNIDINIIESKFPNITFKFKNKRNSSLQLNKQYEELKLINRENILQLSNNNNVYLEFPRTYYLGYTLTNQYNETFPLYKNISGKISTKINKNGKYYLKYTGTIYDEISHLIRKISILILMIYGVKYNEKNSYTNTMLQRRKNYH